MILALQAEVAEGLRVDARRHVPAVARDAEVAVAVIVGNGVAETGGKGVIVGTSELCVAEVAVSTTGWASDATTDPQATFSKTIRQLTINIQYLGKFLFFTGEL